MPYIKTDKVNICSLEPTSEDSGQKFCIFMVLYLATMLNKQLMASPLQHTRCIMQCYWLTFTGMQCWRPQCNNSVVTLFPLAYTQFYVGPDSGTIQAVVLLYHSLCPASGTSDLYHLSFL